MPLNSVQLYVKGLLDGLPIPTMTQQLQAYVTPPTVEDVDGPRAYVLGAGMTGSRQTAPRGPGFKHLDWALDVYLVYETTPDSAGIDEQMALIIDAVMARLWTTTMPLFITDPTTQLVSQILAIGEDFILEYPPERTPATLRMLYYTARLNLKIYEAVQL